MNDSLSEERKQLLQDKFFEFVDDTAPDLDFFSTIENPIEYHYIASIYNWDDGTEVLSWIINSSHCDEGTAKMIFWRAQPSHYTRYLSEDEAGIHADVYALLRNILSNFEKGFYSRHEIGYDPNADPAAEETDYTDPRSKWDIPDFIKEPSPGEPIDFN